MGESFRSIQSCVLKGLVQRHFKVGNGPRRRTVEIVASHVEAEGDVRVERYVIDSAVLIRERVGSSIYIQSSEEKLGKAEDETNDYLLEVEEDIPVGIHRNEGRVGQIASGGRGNVMGSVGYISFLHAAVGIIVTPKVILGQINLRGADAARILDILKNIVNGYISRDIQTKIEPPLPDDMRNGIEECILIEGSVY